jgi:hypothetical protein
MSSFARLGFALAAGVFLACGGESSDAGGSDASTDASVDSKVDATLGDGDFPHDSAPFDDATPVDASDDSGTKCPFPPPVNGNPCSDARTCTYKDYDCAADTIATCAGGTWTVTPGPACPSEHCPEVLPTSAACKTPGQICRYWPSADAAAGCLEMRCDGGVWVDTKTTTCTATRDSCDSTIACTAPFGCVSGKCSPICICGVGGKLVCTAHPC